MPPLFHLCHKIKSFWTDKWTDGWTDMGKSKCPTSSSGCIKIGKLEKQSYQEKLKIKWRKTRKIEKPVNFKYKWILSCYHFLFSSFTLKSSQGFFPVFLEHVTHTHGSGNLCGVLSKIWKKYATKILKRFNEQKE